MRGHPVGAGAGPIWGRWYLPAALGPGAGGYWEVGMIRGIGRCESVGRILDGLRWWGMDLSIFDPSFGVQDFHPFDPLIVVSGGMDCHVKIWSLEGVRVAGEGSWKLPAGLRCGFLGFWVQRWRVWCSSLGVGARDIATSPPGWSCLRLVWGLRAVMGLWIRVGRMRAKGRRGADGV